MTLAMASVEAIQIPLPHVGSVNAWLLRGEPLTVVDTGPRSDEALDAIERGLRLRGVRVEDIELVIGTHHHHDHVGLAATIKRRSGARIAVLAQTADYGERYLDRVAQDRVFARELMRDHGVPEELFGPTEALWDYIGATAESFVADVRLQDGDRVWAGGRELRVVARPGHSATDTLLVDRAARAGVRRGPPAREDLAQHGDLRNGRCEPLEAAHRVSEQPPVHISHATPAAVSRTRSGRI